MQKANFLPQIVFEILKFQKYMPSDWSRAFSFATQELDFSQSCGFHRFPKTIMLYHLKPKNHKLFAKSVLLIYFSALWACLTKPKENDLIKL